MMPPIAGAQRDQISDQLYERIAPLYDAINRDMSAGADDQWRRQALALAQVGATTRAVDWGTGTGEFYLLLRQQIGSEGSVIGLDRSAQMLAVAQGKAAAALPGYHHDLRCIDGYDTGLAADSVDLITLGWVLRSVGNRVSFYREALHILRPGGVLLSLEAFAPGFPPLRWIHDLWMRLFMDARIRRHTGSDRTLYRFVFSENPFPTVKALAKEWSQAGFATATVRHIAPGIAVHMAQKPMPSTTP